MVNIFQISLFCFSSESRDPKNQNEVLLQCCCFFYFFFFFDEKSNCFFFLGRAEHLSLTWDCMYEYTLHKRVGDGWPIRSFAFITESQWQKSLCRGCLGGIVIRCCAPIHHSNSLYVKTYMVINMILILILMLAPSIQYLQRSPNSASSCNLKLPFFSVKENKWSLWSSITLKDSQGTALVCNTRIIKKWESHSYSK